MLRQQLATKEPCSEKLPYVHSSCLGNTVTMNMGSRSLPGIVYHNGDLGNYVIGQFGVYDSSGFMMALNMTR